MKKSFEGGICSEPHLIFSKGSKGKKEIDTTSRRIIFFPDVNDFHCGFDIQDLFPPMFYNDLRMMLSDKSYRSATFSFSKDNIDGNFSSSLELKEIIKFKPVANYAIEFTDTRRKPFLFEAANHLAALRAYAKLLDYNLSTLKESIWKTFGVSKLYYLMSNLDDKVCIFPSDNEKYIQSLKGLNLSYYDLLKI